MLVRALLTTLAVGALLLARGASPPGASAKGIAYFRDAPLSYHAEGSFPGATEVWELRLLLVHQAKKAGFVGIACIHLTKKVRECYGTINLPLGRLKIQGEITNRVLYQLLIVGGVGYYAGSTGIAIFSPSLVTLYIT